MCHFLALRIIHGDMDLYRCMKSSEKIIHILSYLVYICVWQPIAGQVQFRMGHHIYVKAERGVYEVWHCNLMKGEQLGCGGQWYFSGMVKTNPNGQPWALHHSSGLQSVGSVGSTGI